ncbi:hypothetical protein CHS0354_016220 [Potamilus streckersoni]|uniref:TNFR-Cys domain-containing protein n=1 Tax=Potamilus streckersoni TaxID=2493646 RepID=A0AAE0RXP2_9BIVA|nr:hypothetical protein CHS0354_016220 [Potamilus streckersoni]
MRLKELFVILRMVHAIQGHPDCGMYTAANGKSCFLCPPGYYKYSDCNENGKPAGCMPCPDGKFQITCNQATTCASCSSHCRWFNSVIKENCTATSDLVCECKPGYFLINQGGGNGVCNRHGQCPPGQGVSRPGTATVDVQCEPCVSGDNYSNITSGTQQCRKCSTCLTSVTSPCTPYQNTNCSSVTTTIADGLSQTSPSVIIAVCVLAVAVIVLGVGLLIYIFLKRRRRRNHAQENEAGQLPELQAAYGSESTPGPPIQNDTMISEPNTSTSENLTSTDLDIDTDPINLADVHQSETQIRAYTRQRVPHNQETINHTGDNNEDTYAKILSADTLHSELCSSPSNDLNDNTDLKQIIPNGPGNVSETVTQQPDRGGNSSFVTTDNLDSSRAKHVLNEKIVPM